MYVVAVIVSHIKLYVRVVFSFLQHDSSVVEAMIGTNLRYYLESKHKEKWLRRNLEDFMEFENINLLRIYLKKIFPMK